jgi:hypothetical protein
MKRDGLGWQPPPLPDDPAERRKIALRLVIVAALGVIADHFHHCRVVTEASYAGNDSELCMVVQIEVFGPAHQLCQAGRAAVA